MATDRRIFILTVFIDAEGVVGSPEELEADLAADAMHGGLHNYPGVEVTAREATRYASTPTTGPQF